MRLNDARIRSSSDGCRNSLRYSALFLAKRRCRCASWAGDSVRAMSAMDGTACAKPVSSRASMSWFQRHTCAAVSGPASSPCRRASVAALGADRIIAITGHGAAEVETASSAPGLQFVRQEPQLGTGHAVQQAGPLLHDAGTTLILNGDVPLIEAATARHLVDDCGGRRLSLLTIELDDPVGYGRVVRDGEAVRGIV